MLPKQSKREDFMLRVSNLCKNFNTFRLSQISFDLPTGYIMGLIGENGAGKSTLIKTIMGIYKPDDGELSIDHCNIRTNEQGYKNNIAAVLDENYYPLNYSANDCKNLLGKFYTNFSNNEFDRYLKRFNLNPKQHIKKLSKGQFMKLQLAFALSYDAKLLLLDEPSAHLDYDSRIELNQIMADFVSSGEKSVMISTHLTEDLDTLADYITFIHDGHLLFSKTKEALFDEYEDILDPPTVQDIMYNIIKGVPPKC